MSYEYSKNYIDGRWVATKFGKVRQVEDPFTLSMVGFAPDSSLEDIRPAVESATRAFQEWRYSSRSDRQQVLTSMRSAIIDNIEELAMIWSLEVGTPITTARQATSFLPIRVLEDLVLILEKFEFSQNIGTTAVSRTPIGPVAAITPWNYPLSQLVIKCASALAAGCTVVAKPSEVAPLCAFRFIELLSEYPLPPGLINIIGGDGPVIGNALVKSDEIKVVSFTGSTTTGRSIATICGSRLIKSCLELGGKSASVVLDQAVLETAVKATIASCIRNSGQTCTSLTRLIVPESFVNQASDMCKELMGTMVMGDPRDSKTDIGPLASLAQQQRALKIIQSGVDQGAKRILGNQNDRPLQSTGYFVPPTIFTEVRPEMRIAREEIFAPVLSIFVSQSRHHALEIANDSEYGLAGTVWSSEIDDAKDFAKHVESGTITINGGAFNPSAPYGGVKASGLGRELGAFGMEEFLEYRTFHGANI